MIIKTRHVKNIQYKYGQEDKKPGGANGANFKGGHCPIAIVCRPDGDLPK